MSFFTRLEPHANRVGIWGTAIGVVWGFMSWAASNVAPLAGYGWGTFIFVGLGSVCVLLLCLSTALASWRYFHPIVQAPPPQTNVEANQEPSRRPFVPIAPIVEVEVDIGRLTAASPWVEFHCTAYNATAHNVGLVSADGRIRIGPELFHARIELDPAHAAPTRLAHVDCFFRFTLRVPLTAAEAQLIPRGRDAGYFTVRFADAFVSAFAATDPSTTTFRIAVPEEMQFDSHTRRTQPALTWRLSQ